MTCVAAGLAQAGFGASVNIGDFETVTLDGWGTDGTFNAPSPALSQSTVGVTSGSFSLASQNPAANFWGPATGNLIGEGYASALQNASTLSYDLTLDSSALNGGSGSFNGFAQDNEIAITLYGNGGALNMFLQQSWGAAGVSDSLGQSAGWNGVDGTRHLVWDLTKFTATDPIGGGTKTLAQFVAAYPSIVDSRIGFVQQSGGASNTVGNPIFYFDNVRLEGPGIINLTTTNTLAISTVTNARGLYFITSSNDTVSASNPQYQRQNIQTVTSNAYSWMGNGSGGVGTVTYALTITNFPGSTYSNFQAHVILVPYTDGSLPTEPNPDWAESAVIYLDIENQADGSATAQFRYKVGAPAANTDSLVTVTNSSSAGGALGKWSMTLTNDDAGYISYATITAPGGDAATTNLPFAYGITYFVNPMTVYIGVQPDLTNNIGQQAIFSNFQIISNGVPLLNDSFTSIGLDSSTWALAAEDPNGVLQISPSAAFLLTWNVPDTGYRLISNGSLSNTTWQTSLLPKSLYKGRRIVVLPSSTTNQFFRLSNP